MLLFRQQLVSIIIDVPTKKVAIIFAFLYYFVVVASSGWLSLSNQPTKKAIDLQTGSLSIKYKYPGTKVNYFFYGKIISGFLNAICLAKLIQLLYY